MRVISNKALIDFAALHPHSAVPLQAWRKMIESRPFLLFSDLKRAFHAIDKVDDYCIFNIGGNKFRIVAAVHFGTQKCFVRHVFTHKEYDTWKP